jgi:hypothetical protein
MNNQIIVPIAIIVLIGIIIALIFLNRKDEEEFEEQLKQDLPKKRISDTDEGEKQTI